MGCKSKYHWLGNVSLMTVLASFICRPRKSRPRSQFGSAMPAVFKAVGIRSTPLTKVLTLLRSTLCGNFMSNGTCTSS